MNRRIVCAANRYIGKVIVVGVRHCDALMRANVQFKCDDREEQGFVDNRGEFLSRTEAWPIAMAAGQIIRRCGGDDTDGGTLYSENLY